MPQPQQYIKILAVSSSSILVAGLSGKLLGMFNTLALARILGPEQLGVFVLALAIMQIFSALCPLGFPLALTRSVAYYDSLQDYGRVKGIFFTAIVLSMAISIFASVAIYYSTRFFSQIFNSEHLSPVLTALSWSLPFFVLFSLLLAALQGLRFPAQAAWIKALVEPPFRLAIFLVLALFGFRLFGAVSSVFCAILLSCGYALFVFFKKFPWRRYEAKPTYAWSDLSFSLALFLITAISLSVQWTDNLFIGYFLTTRDVALYDVAFRIAGLMTLVHVSANAAITPLFAESFALRRPQDIEALYKVNTRWVVMLTLPIFGILLLLSRDVLSLFGRDFAEGAFCLMILASGLFSSIVAGPCGTLLLMGGRARLYLVISAATGVLNFLLNIILIPRYGIVGAAVAAASTYFLDSGLTVVTVIKLYGIRPYDHTFVKPWIAGLIATGALAIMVTTGMMGTPSFLRLVTGGLFLLAIYVASLSVLGWEDGDREIIRSLVVRR